MKREKGKVLGKARISVKLAFLYMALLLVSWSIIFFIFYRVSDKNVMDSARALSAQTLNTVSKNILTLIDNTAYYSRIILSSSDITKALEMKDEKMQKESLHQFTSLVDTETHINGIYMWDMDSHGCSIDKNHVRTLRMEEIRKTNWYEEVRELAGSYCIKLNADRVLTQSSAETTVSLIRVINNPTDYRPVGILMINMDLNAFTDSYSGLDEESVPVIYVLDDTGKIVTSQAEIPLPRVKESLKSHKNSSRLYLAQQGIDHVSWKVLAGVQIENGLEQSGIGRIITLLRVGRQIETVEEGAKDVIDQIQDYMEENYAQSSLSLSMVAEKYYLNSSYLSRTFRKKTGIPFVEYLNKIRIKHACDYLKSGNWKVYEIAEKVGIPNPDYFGRCFRKYMGISVNDYKKSKICED